MSIILDNEQRKLAEELVASGRFSSVKEAISHALRVLVDKERGILEHTRELAGEEFYAEIDKGFTSIEAGHISAATPEDIIARVTSD